MVDINREALVRTGDWRTLESSWGTTGFSCIFNGPVGARVKVRYGDGRYRGYNSQLQTLTGDRVRLSVGKLGILHARVQIRVRSDQTVYWTYIAADPVDHRDDN